MTVRLSGEEVQKAMAIVSHLKGLTMLVMAAGMVLTLTVPLVAADQVKGAAPQAKAKSKANSKRRVRSRPEQSKPETPPGNKDAKSQDTKSKTDAANTPPKPATVWSQEKIDNELARCRDILSKIDAVAIPMQGFRKNKCGAAAPIQLISVGKSPEIVFSPPARVTCKLAGALHKWITGDIQKLAKKHFNAQIIGVEVMSDYSCRNAYGRKGGRLSEHALVNALDIRGFVTSSGKYARLLAHWGPTRRDIAAEIAEAQKQADARQAAIDKENHDKALVRVQGPAVGKTKGATLRPDTLVKTPSTKDKGVAKLAMTHGQRGVTVSLPNVKKPPPRADATRRQAKRVATASITKATVPLNKRVGRSGWFLRQAHASGCKIFGTILGPEANNAHRNHFHVDMAPRRRSNFCE